MDGERKRERDVKREREEGLKGIERQREKERESVATAVTWGASTHTLPSPVY